MIIREREGENEMMHACVLCSCVDECERRVA